MKEYKIGGITYRFSDQRKPTWQHALDYLEHALDGQEVVAGSEFTMQIPFRIKDRRWKLIPLALRDQIEPSVFLEYQAKAVFPDHSPFLHSRVFGKIQYSTCPGDPIKHEGDLWPALYTPLFPLIEKLGGILHQAHGSKEKQVTLDDLALEVACSYIKDLPRYHQVKEW